MTQVKVESYKERYDKIKKQEEQFIDFMFNDIVSFFADVWMKPLTIGNMVYFYTEYNGRYVPAYCYLNDYERGDISWLPIYDENNSGCFGWSNIEEVVRILDVIRDKFYKECFTNK